MLEGKLEEFLHRIGRRDARHAVKPIWTSDVLDDQAFNQLCSRRHSHGLMVQISAAADHQETSLATCSNHTLYHINSYYMISQNIIEYAIFLYVVSTYHIVGTHSKPYMTSLFGCSCRPLASGLIGLDPREKLKNYSTCSRGNSMLLDASVFLFGFL